MRDDSGDWVVNGQKIFTTRRARGRLHLAGLPHGSVESRHRGITILIVDTKDPGYSWTPIITCDGRASHQRDSYFDDVRVPADMLVGEGERGLAADHHPAQPRAGQPRSVRQDRAALRRVREWAQPRGVLGETDVRRSLRAHARHGPLNELLNWQVAATVDGNPASVIADASATKVFSTEALQEAGRLAEEIVGRYGDPAEPATAELLTWLDRRTKQNLVVTFGGGRQQGDARTRPPRPAEAAASTNSHQTVLVEKEPRVPETTSRKRSSPRRNGSRRPVIARPGSGVTR